MNILTKEEKDNATYLGDGLYMIDHGYQIELFAYNGITKTDSVYLDDDVLETFLNIIKNRV